MHKEHRENERQHGAEMNATAWRKGLSSDLDLSGSTGRECPVEYGEMTWEK